MKEAKLHGAGIIRFIFPDETPTNSPDYNLERDMGRS